MKPERRGLFLVVVVILLSAVLGAIYGPNVRATSSSIDAQTSVRDFTRVLDIVQSNYAEPVDADKLIYEGAIPGMLRVLDPHSNFFDARQWALSQEDRTVVMAPYLGTPAYNAGLRPGDVITKIDDKSTAGKNTTEIADQLRGA